MGGAPRRNLLPAFGEMSLEAITTEGVERWAVGLTADGRMNNRTKLKILTVLHRVMKRANHVGEARATRSLMSRSPSRPTTPRSTSSARRGHGARARRRVRAG